MYRVVIQNGSIECAEYDLGDHGVELYEDGDFVAFVPYENLLAVVDEETETTEDRSVL
ncbi:MULTISPECIES: hypothetical protein [Haloarcula]|uniref:hypothetical protein n=1 Tax=Haloarcula TaxID=2237 RepID=UPI0023E85C40|nr:hypothetical protein [Halomicroarcula sp. SHR3]